MVDDWLVVETLASAGPYTVIADGSRRKRWASLTRVRPAHRSAAAQRLVGVVQKCVDSGSAQEHRVAGKRGSASLRVLGVPVLGTFGAVHAVHLWLGSDGSEPPSRRTVAAWHWDAVTELAYPGPGLEESFHGIPPGEQQTVRSATENFRYIVRFDDRLGYIALCVNVDGGGEWQGEVTLRGSDGMLRQVQMVARACSQSGERLIRGLFHDITDVRPPELTVETSALRTVAAVSGGGVGLIALETALIYDWISPPAAPLDRWLTELPIIHEADKPILYNACRCLISDSDRQEISIRVRFSDTGWIAVDEVLTTINRDLAPHGLVRVKPSESSL